MKIVEAHTIKPFSVHLHFEDGADGIVDLSALATQGVFKAWQQPGMFEQMKLNPYGFLEWPGDLDLCGDSLYLELTHKTPEELFSIQNNMPEISRFYGIVIQIFYRDHAPPHFHAFYGRDKAIIAINTLSLMEGKLPPRALGLVIEWTSLHQKELLLAFQNAQKLEPLFKIAPLK